MEDIKLLNAFLQACKEDLHSSPWWDGSIARPISVMLASNDHKKVGYAEGWIKDVTEHSGIPIGSTTTRKRPPTKKVDYFILKGQATQYLSDNRYNGNPFDPTKTENIDFEIICRPSVVVISLMGLKIVNPMYKLRFSYGNDQQIPAWFCIFYGLEEIPEGYVGSGYPYPHTLFSIGLKRTF